VGGSSCPAYRDLVLEAATDPAGPVLLRELEAHLSVCGACRAEWESLRQVVAWVREVPEPSVPPGFWYELQGRLKRQAGQQGRRARWARAAKAAALAVLAALAVHRATPPPGPLREPEVVSPAVRALLPQVSQLAQVWGAGLIGEVDR
jgi:predicted anti-sigma-YlaC factor YlaD